MQKKETGAWYLMRARPYKTWDNRIAGAVISFQDIDAIPNLDALERNLDQMRQHAETLIENAREAILILDGRLQVISANLVFEPEEAFYLL